MGSVFAMKGQGGFMKKLTYYSVTVLLLTGVWVILTESHAAANLLIGVVFSALILLVMSTLQHEEHVFVPRFFSLKVLLHYTLYLVWQIYLSGLQMIAIIFTGNMKVDLVDVTTQLKSDLSVSILACSITLTPGTVSVMREGDRLLVLWIDCISKDPKIVDPMVKKKLEDILLLSERRYWR